MLVVAEAHMRPSLLYALYIDSGIDMPHVGVGDSPFSLLCQRWPRPFSPLDASEALCTWPQRGRRGRPTRPVGRPPPSAPAAQ